MAAQRIRLWNKAEYKLEYFKNRAAMNGDSNGDGITDTETKDYNVRNFLKNSSEGWVFFFYRKWEDKHILI